MKFFARRRLGLFFTLLLLCSGNAAALTLSDPLVGVEFDSSHSGIEELDAAEVARMALPAHMAAGRWWVFARHRAGDREYLVLSGFWRRPLDTEPETYGAPAQDFGSVAVRTETGYVFLGTADMLSGGGLDLSPELRRTLLDNYAASLVKAFCGVGNLEKELIRQHSRPWTHREVARALLRAGVKPPAWWGEDPGASRPDDPKDR